MKKLFILVFLIFMLVFINLAYALECVFPRNDMAITGNITFCRGEYAVPDGFVIENDKVAVDCNGAVLKGDFGGTAFRLKNKKNIAVKNCIIEQFDYAYYFDGVENYDIKENELKNVINEIFTAKIKEENAEEKEEEKPNFLIPAGDGKEEIKPPVNADNTDKNIFYDIAEQLGIRQEDIIKAEVAKSYTIRENELIINVNIPKLNGAYNIYEAIPKTLAETPEKIIFDKEEFLTAFDDPLKVWLGADLGQGKTYQYTILDTKGRNDETYTIITKENPKEIVKRFPMLRKKHDTENIRNFFALLAFLIFAAVYHYEKKIEMGKC